MSVPYKKIKIVTAKSPLVKKIINKISPRRSFSQKFTLPANQADICETDPEQIALIVNAAFWASLEVEEGRPVQGVLCITSQGDAMPLTLAFKLSEPKPVEINSIVELLTAAPNGALAIHSGPDGKPQIWGICEDAPFKYLKFRIAKAGTVIVFCGADMVAIIDNANYIIPQKMNQNRWWKAIGKFLDPKSKPHKRIEMAEDMLPIVFNMFRHGHGGTLIVVPVKDGQSLEDLDIKYKFEGTKGSDLFKNARDELKIAWKNIRKILSSVNKKSKNDYLIMEKQKEYLEYKDAMILRQIGNFTALDGAVVIGDDFTLYGFGAKIISPQVEGLQITEVDLLNRESKKMEVTNTGGTRHQSAVRFVKNNNEALVFVASQDSHVTLYTWSTKDNQVVGFKNLHHMMWEC